MLGVKVFEFHWSRERLTLSDTRNDITARLSQDRSRDKWNDKFRRRRARSSEREKKKSSSRRLHVLTGNNCVIYVRERWMFVIGNVSRRNCGIRCSREAKIRNEGREREKENWRQWSHLLVRCSFCRIDAPTWMLSAAGTTVHHSRIIDEMEVRARFSAKTCRDESCRDVFTAVEPRSITSESRLRNGTAAILETVGEWRRQAANREPRCARNSVWISGGIPAAVAKVSRNITQSRRNGKTARCVSRWPRKQLLRENFLRTMDNLLFKRL